MPADANQIKDVFLAAAALAPDERSWFLAKTCGQDVDLRVAVERLLVAHDHPDSLLERQAPTIDMPSPQSPEGRSPTVGTSFYGSTAIEVGVIIGGRYKLLELLGAGGMGVVWLAEQLEPVRRKVALKIIKPGMDSRAVLARFEAERQALALMDHPNIARVLDAATTQDGRPFFVMELVKGIPITEFCDARRLNPRQRLELFIPVCRAIQHAHQKGIIHRDVKPSNVLVATYDETPVPKVIDFGVAKATGQPLTDKTLHTGFEAVVGTPAYMSPEQATFNELDVDTRSDVYSLGVLLYEILTGTTPIERDRFRAAALLEMLRLVREEEAPRPSARLSTTEARAQIAATRGTEAARLSKLLRGELDWIVMKALEKNRNRRYGSAAELALDLGRYLADEVVEARPPSMSYQVKKFVRKHRGPVLATASILVTAIAGFAISIWQAVLAAEAEAEAKKNEATALFERNNAIVARDAETEAKRKAETLAGSALIDLDLRLFEERKPELGMLRLCRTLQSLPLDARELREFATLTLLAAGQLFQPSFGFTHDGSDFPPEFAPDLRTAATLTPADPSIVRLWDVKTGQLRATLTGHDEATAASFTEWGNVLTTTDRAERIRIWNAFTGQLIGTVGPKASRILALGISPDGHRAVCTEVGEGLRCQLRDVQTGNVIAVLWTHPHLGLIGSVAVNFSPCGRWLYAPVPFSPGTLKPQRPTVWDAETGRVAWQPDGIEGGWHLSFAPDSKLGLLNTSRGFRWFEPGTWQTLGVSDLPLQGGQAGFISNDLFAEHPSLAGLGGAPDWSELEIRVLRPGRPLPLTVPHLMSRVDFVSRSRTDSSFPITDGRLLIATSGVAYSLDRWDVLRPPPGRRFHPSIGTLGMRNRYVVVGRSVIDAMTDKIVFPILRSEDGLVSARFAKPERDNVTGLSQRFWGPGPELTSTSPSHCLSLPATADVDVRVLSLWLEVVSCCRLDENGEVARLTESQWETRRVALRDVISSSDEKRIMQWAASDRYYWLRREADRFTEAPADEADGEVFERLIVVDQRLESYRMAVRGFWNAQEYGRAIKVMLAGAKRHDSSLWRSRFREEIDAAADLMNALQPGGEKSTYELVLQWSVEQRRQFPGYYVGPHALALYRLGRYAESLDLLREEDNQAQLWVGDAGLTGAALALGRFSGLVKLAVWKRPFPTISGLILRAMCHYRLGRPLAARECLAAQTQESQRKSQPRANMNHLLSEAKALIEGSGDR